VDSQPVGICLASPGRRLGSHFLAYLLFVVTLGIGYVVWALIVWRNGTTPPKQLLKMRVIKIAQDETAGWWRMLLRFLSKSFLEALGLLDFLLSFWLITFLVHCERRRAVVGTSSAPGESAPAPRYQSLYSYSRAAAAVPLSACLAARQRLAE
jgi:RDD family